MRQFDEIKEQYLRWCKSWYAWAIEKQLYVIGQLIEAHTYVCDHHEKAKVDIAAMQIEIKELQAQLAEANERADKAAQDGWLKTAETQLARAKKAEAQLAEVAGLPEKWLEDTVIENICGTRMAVDNDMDRKDCANELQAILENKP